MESRTRQLLPHSLSNLVPSAQTPLVVKVPELTLVSTNGKNISDSLVIAKGNCYRLNDRRSAAVERMVGERRSRIHGPYHQRESGDGMDAAELAAQEQRMNIGQLGMSAKHLLPFYQKEIPDSGEEADDERAQ